MNILEVNDYEQLSKKCADALVQLVLHKPDAYICLATGYSPKRMYERFVDEINTKQIDISQITFIKLDEWYGVAPSASYTCTSFIKEHLLDKLYMPPKQLFEFQSDTSNIQQELTRIDDIINAHPIDVMILGLGMDGHLGLNEPSDSLTLASHESLLHPKTKTHTMVKDYCIEKGMTIGLKGIFDAKLVLMLVTGENKEDAYRAFMSQQITTKVPASLLWLHPNCLCVIDRSHFH